ncbi:MAG: ECF-type sigma factor [Gammaproteobacteria bacterium]|nr:ECF-type sigma factor [Gammaproteobacteria bacterium]
MRNERPGHTLEPGALVNEAFLKLAQEQLQGCSRRQVTAMFARSMREILVDHARRKAALKRGGDARQITLNNDDIQPAGDLLQDDLLALDYALNALANEHPRLGDIVQMRYFLGLTIDEVADTLQVSPATVKRDWLYARAWLYERLSI